eukprot:3970949-Alexandrium_andersonii.AAC.1
MPQSSPASCPGPDGAAARAQSQGRGSAEERPAGPAEATRVCLQVVAADGSHQPRPLSTNSREPLRSLMQAYTQFRQAAAPGSFVFYGPDQRRLAATRTASYLGLADGDVITAYEAGARPPPA